MSWIRPNPTRHWLGNVQVGVNYAIVVSTCAGLWSHIIGDTVRFESLNPAAVDLHRPDEVHAVGLWRAPDQRGSREGRSPIASDLPPARPIGEWHVGPVFFGPLGHHRYVIEFLKPPDGPRSLSARPSTPTSRERNADYLAHRGEGVLIAFAGHWSLPGPEASTPGCVPEASSAASTRFPGWITPEP